jgi:Spy/CpxP family protein refolding chaperone
MKLRHLLTCSVAFALVGSSAVMHAQEKKGRGMGTPEQQIERIEQAVGSLSAEQKTKLKGIYAKMSEKMQAIPQDERREKGMELMRATRAEVRAVLTAEQQKKYDEMSQGWGQGGKKGN